MNIVLSDVTVRFPSAPAPLFHLPRFEVASGAHVLVHGTSGHGKTTLLHLLSGQFLPASGSVFVGDTEITTRDESARARFRRTHFGLIFQRWNLIDHLTVLENVMLAIPDAVQIGVKEKERKRARAETALRDLGLSRLAAQRAGLVSPGEQQRIAVAKVRAAGPAIVLADEPTSHLDDPGAANVFETLFDSCQGRTLIVVSHDPRARAHFRDARDFTSLIAASPHTLSPSSPSLAPHPSPATAREESRDELREELREESRKASPEQSPQAAGDVTPP